LGDRARVLQQRLKGIMETDINLFASSTPKFLSSVVQFANIISDGTEGHIEPETLTDEKAL